LGRVYEGILNPSFKSYNVARSFGLKWVVGFDVLSPGGERVVGSEKLKGEVKVGGVRVRGCPDGVREGVIREGEGVGVGELGEVDWEGLQGRDGDSGEEEEDGFEGVSGGGSKEKVGLLDAGDDGKGEKKGRRGLWRRSHDGDKKKGKEEYVEEDRVRARTEEGMSDEQLPKYEA
jgi:hypothetical protein